MRGRPRIITLTTVALLLAPAGVAAAQGSPRAPAATTRASAPVSRWRINGIEQHNRMLLARAAALGKTDGVVLIATEMGRTPAVVQAAVSLGAQLLARFDDVGYLRVRVPLSKFAALRALPGVLITQLDGSAYVYEYEYDNVRYEKPKLARADSIREDSVRRDSTAKDSAKVAALPPPPARALDAESPFTPANEMRSYDLTRMDRRFDGRGVTIAILESGTLDFLHPSLRMARNADGDSIAKIRGVISPLAYEPDLPAARSLIGDESMSYGYATPDRNVVRRSRLVTVDGGRFVADDTTYTMPENGTFSFGRFTRDKASYAVLWDETRKLVWLDTDGDKDFADEQGMPDINTRFAAGMLKAIDSTAKEPKRTMSFAVQIDSIPGRVRIHLGTQGHQTMVATVAAGHNLLGGAANASAPGAQVVIVDAGRSLGLIIEGFVRAERDPRVDVVTCSQIGGSFPSAGESMISLVLNRAIEVYGKPIFASAHNSGPGSNSTGEPAATPRVISVGAYVSGETYKAHFGWEMPRRDWLIHYSSRGPSENGALKPDLVASMLSISGEACSALPVQKTLIYRMPRCYYLAGGTSSASPHAAGTAALLISAARQSNLPSDERHISWALRTGARYMSDYEANEQGNGLIDVLHAYELLKLGVDLPDIEVRAPVRSVLAPYLREPGVGNGLYLREGWRAGQVGMESITLTRRSGPAAPVTYTLRWRANDGTFSTSLTSVTLPLDVAVRIPVRVAPASVGMHSAQLQVVDRASSVPVHEVLATVVAADRFTPENAYTVRRTASIPWQSAQMFYVDVPADAPVLRIDLGVKTGKVHIRLSDMTSHTTITGSAWLRPYRWATRPQEIVGGQRATLIVPNPDPGVMGILVEPYNRGAWGIDTVAYHVNSEVELTVALVGGEARAVAAANKSDAARFALVNRYAPLGEASLVHAVGVRREIRGVADRTREHPEFNVVVDSGTTSLRISLATANPNLSLYLYDCAGARCALWEDKFTSASNKAIVVVKPRAGLWKVIVDPAGAVPGGSPFTYTEIVTHPRYGSGDASAMRVARTTGAKWEENSGYRRASAAPPGFQLVGVTDLVDEAMERSERERPLNKFDDHLTPYRPARLGTIIVPLGSESRTARTASP